MILSVTVSVMPVFQRRTGRRRLCSNARCDESTWWWPGQNQPRLSIRSCDWPLSSGRFHPQVNESTLY